MAVMRRREAGETAWRSILARRRRRIDWQFEYTAQLRARRQTWFITRLRGRCIYSASQKEVALP